MRPESWSDKTYIAREDDMHDVLDALKNDPQLRDRIDFSRLALAGHSLGGYTVLGLAGAWPSWKTDDVKAVLALSPYSHPFNLQNTLGDLKVPVMYQGGTRDSGITPWVVQKDGSYDQTSTRSGAPKYFVEFDRANHLAWTDLHTQYQASIIAYSEAFLDHYVKGLPATPALTKMRDDVSEMKYDSDLGKFDSTASGN
jgi:predicted dienelactone hydrolase